jgi:hypothetical protein
MGPRRVLEYQRKGHEGWGFEGSSNIKGKDREGGWLRRGGGVLASDLEFVEAVLERVARPSEGGQQVAKGELPTALGGHDVVEVALESLGLFRRQSHPFPEPAIPAPFCNIRNSILGP